MLVTVLFLGASLGALPAYSQEVPASTRVQAAASPTPAQTPKGKKTREKEAEGTQALNRFEADTILKSRYTLDGQPLEVDPD